jgi:hypothetical protein
MHNKVYHMKFILIILIVQMYVLKVFFYESMHSKLHKTKVIHPAGYQLVVIKR